MEGEVQDDGIRYGANLRGPSYDSWHDNDVRFYATYGDYLTAMQRARCLSTPELQEVARRFVIAQAEAAIRTTYGASALLVGQVEGERLLTHLRDGGEDGLRHVQTQLLEWREQLRKHDGVWVPKKRRAKRRKPIVQEPRPELESEPEEVEE